MGVQKGMSKSTKYAIGGVLLAIILISMYVFVFNPGAPTGQTSTTLSTSSFRTYSNVDREDVSNFAELEIWTPKDGVNLSSDAEIHDYANFERNVGPKDAEDISIDLTDIEGFWVKTVNSTYWRESWVYFRGEVNSIFNINVYQTSSDVNFAILDDTDLSAWTKAENGNFTIYADFPHLTHTNLHYGTDWAISEDDYDAYSNAKLLDMWDEVNWRCQPALYILSEDSYHEFDEPLGQITDTFAFKLQFNATISQVDGASNSTQVNITLQEEYANDWDIVISGVYAYIISHNTLDAPFDAGFSIELGTCILCSQIYSGRIKIPYTDYSLGTYTAYSAVGA